MPPLVIIFLYSVVVSSDKVSPPYSIILFVIRSGPRDFLFLTFVIAAFTSCTVITVFSSLVLLVQEVS